MRRPRGFTLVEVLVALAIMALLATMAWQGVDGMVRARDAGREQTERSLLLATVIAQWEQDLLALQDERVVPALTFDGATVRIVRAAPRGVQVVAWSLQDGQWKRWIGPDATRAAELIDSWQRSQGLLGNEAGQLKLLDGVSEVQLYFYRGNGWSNAQSSGDTAADAAGAQQRELLPTGVRLVLTFADSRRLTRDIVLAPQWP